MANKMEKVAQETANAEDKTETTEKFEETTATESKVVDLTEQPKKGFWRDMSVGMKIGFGLTIGAIAFGAGYLVKRVFFSGSDNDDAIPVEGTVSDDTEE